MVAAMVGLSYTPTYERIKHLEESGVIKKSAVILNPSKVGIKLFAYCNVTFKTTIQGKFTMLRRRSNENA